MLLDRPAARHVRARTSSPKRPASDYEPSRYLKLLQEHREHFTVFSGMSHRYAAGHFAEVGAADRRRPENIRAQRHPQHHLARSGSRLAHRQPDAFRLAGPRRRRRRLEPPRRPHSRRSSGPRRSSSSCSSRHAGRGSPRDAAASTTARASSTASAARSKSINNKLGAADRQRLDLYLTSIREAEQRLQQDEHWGNTPKPQVNVPPPTERLRRPAAARSAAGSGTTSSTSPCRPIRRASSRSGSARRNGPRSKASPSPITTPRTTARTRAKLEQLALIEEAEVQAARRIPRQDEEAAPKASTRCSTGPSSSTPATWATPRRTTTTTCRSCSPAAASSTQGHVAFDRKNNTPLSNLFVRMLQQMGIEAKSFGASTGVVSEI